MKYNYVFFNIREKYKDGFYEICLRDISKWENVIITSRYMEHAGAMLRFFRRMCFSKTVNNIVSVPFKKIFYPMYFKNTFKDDKPLCFIFCCHYEDVEYIRYLRKKYPDCRIIKMHRDLIKLWRQKHPDFTEKVIKELFDVVMAYDENEAKEYDAVHFNEFESKIDVGRDKNYPIADVFFAGAAKERLPQIMDAYKVLTDAGLNVLYYLVGVPKQQQGNYPGITYSDKWLPYKKMLYYSVNSRCILEINQGDSVGYTSRFLEAVIYGKKLITNNCSIENSPFYNSEYIQCVKNMKDLNPDFVRKDVGEIDYGYTDKFSPKYLFERIDNMLIDMDENRNR